MLNQLYVDDLLVGADDTEAALAIASAAKDMFAKIKMKLYRWLSNCPDLLKCLQETHGEPTKSILLQFVPTDTGTKALGVRWGTSTDVLCFDPTFLIEAAKQKPTGHTKIDMHKLSSKIVDPLGLISPIILEMRMLHQQLWAKGVQWDGAAPPELEVVWQRISDDLHHVTDVRVPRWIGTL